MKFVLVAVALFVASAANPIPEWNVPPDDQIPKTAHSCATSNADLPEYKLLNCILKCMLEKLGIFDETSGFNVENVVKVRMEKYQFSESAARATAEKCAVEKEASESSCDWAARGLECLRTRSKEQ